MTKWKLELFVQSFWERETPHHRRKQDLSKVCLNPRRGARVYTNFLVLQTPSRVCIRLCKHGARYIFLKWMIPTAISGLGEANWQLIQTYPALVACLAMSERFEGIETWQSESLAMTEWHAILGKRKCSVVSDHVPLLFETDTTLSLLGARDQYQISPAAQTVWRAWRFM